MPEGFVVCPGLEAEVDSSLRSPWLMIARCVVFDFRVAGIVFVGADSGGFLRRSGRTRPRTGIEAAYEGKPDRVKMHEHIGLNRLQ